MKLDRDLRGKRQSSGYGGSANPGQYRPRQVQPNYGGYGGATPGAQGASSGSSSSKTANFYGGGPEASPFIFKSTDSKSSDLGMNIAA